MPDKYLMVRIHKSLQAQGGYYNWYNQHVIKSPFGLESWENTSTLLNAVARLEASFHHKQVLFRLATVGEYGGQADDSPGVTERVYNLAEKGVIGQRNVNEYAPPEIALCVHKVSTHFRPSKNFYFGCLGTDDYEQDKNNRLTLTNFEWWYQAVSFVKPGLFDPTGCEFVQAVNPTSTQQALMFLPVTFSVGTAVKCNALARWMNKRDERLSSIFEEIISQAHSAIIMYQKLRQFWIENGDFVPDNAQGMASSTVVGFTSIKKRVEDLFNKGQPPLNGKASKPMFRFPPLESDLMALAHAAKFQADMIQQEIDKEQKWYWQPDDKEYFRHGSAETFMLAAERGAAKWAEFLEFDWKTPFQSLDENSD